jgi:hypothetical protein
VHDKPVYIYIYIYIKEGAKILRTTCESASKHPNLCEAYRPVASRKGGRQPEPPRLPRCLQGVKCLFLKKKLNATAHRAERRNNGSRKSFGTCRYIDACTDFAVGAHPHDTI